MPAGAGKPGCRDGVTGKAVVKGGSMKAIWLLGLLSLLLIVAYDKVASAPSAGTRSPDRSITLPGTVATGSSENLPEGLSKYVLLHQARYESIPVHAMAGVKACLE